MAGAKKRKRGQVGIQEGKTAIRRIARQERNIARVAKRK
jgi:hypothetical protein